MKSPFRSIRQTLFNEGKLLRYLGYAIGEIALIIIGILFAIQISNWNADRKVQVEFEIYIEQLKVDVQTAIEGANTSKTFAERNVEHCDFVLSFLKLSKYEPEDLATFEAGISNIGNYNEPQISVGLLGDLLNGNMNIISRDRNLAKMALKMESNVERTLSNLSHIYNQIDLASNTINLLRGKGNINQGVRPTYDLEKLKASDEFFYATDSIASRMRTNKNFSGSLVEELEEFLAVLEEY